jgi:hypothetical protein
MNEQGANSESTEAKPYFETEVLTERAAIVKKLNGVCNQLLQWGLAHNVADARRVPFFRAAIYASSVQLQALHDKEIDQLMMEIESIKKHVGMVKE